ncbi:Uncharacterized conserved protein [Raoultella terrigena]|uniref:Uncharacterized conserved protein n=1 Tax=Raoultella terrigena TaxID=577 RepID=A0A4U9D9M8_RAOTE|nr:Uncharacterized conserved protein [Raoultella terrigena]
MECPVEKQFKAYNAHDINQFIACFSEDFKAYRMPAESPTMNRHSGVKGVLRQPAF